MPLWSGFYKSSLIILPVISWMYFLWYLLEDKQKEKQLKLFYQRHNCVVMYSKFRGMTGWPPDLNFKEAKMSMKEKMNLHFEPICYFISTAQSTLDIAIMMVTIKTVADAVIAAHRRGVKVRMIVDFLAMNNTTLRELKNSGISINCYVTPFSGTESIMHYKYMVKDYSEGGGFACAGSMNWTITGLFNNFESIVFSSDPDFVKALHNNFVRTWDFIEFSKSSFDTKAKMKLLQQM